MVCSFFFGGEEFAWRFLGFGDGGDGGGVGRVCARAFFGGHGGVGREVVMVDLRRYLICWQITCGPRSRSAELHVKNQCLVATAYACELLMRLKLSYNLVVGPLDSHSVLSKNQGLCS